jgi:hypothetical protein
MRVLKFLFFAALLLFLTSGLYAQDSTKAADNGHGTQHGIHFIDEDGDGYNDNAPDHDGDGIPNGLDPDWQKEKEKKGKRNRWRFVDLDGDGINDNLQEKDGMDGLNKQKHPQQQNPSSIEGQETKGTANQKRKKGGKD